MFPGEVNAKHRVGVVTFGQDIGRAGSGYGFGRLGDMGRLLLAAGRAALARGRAVVGVWHHPAVVYPYFCAVRSLQGHFSLYRASRADHNGKGCRRVWCPAVGHFDVATVAGCTTQSGHLATADVSHVGGFKPGFRTILAR